MPSGRTLWDELVVRYSRGVEGVAEMRAPLVDACTVRRCRALCRRRRLPRIQEQEAQWWRDACIAYFQTLSKRPLPAGYAAPAHPLD